ncbi:MAG TPA: PP2C family protein-serine/threonine phosphatase [Planctomycetota bacterium]
MTPRDSHDSAVLPRRPAGPGLATRITLGITLFSLLFAVPATWLLLTGAKSLNEETAEQTRRDMAIETARLRSAEARLPANMAARDVDAGGGLRLQVGPDVAVDTLDGPQQAHVYRVVGAGPEGGEQAVLFAPAGKESEAGKRLVVLVLLVTGGLVLLVLIVTAVISRRAVAPVKAMVEDVLAVSRGRIDHAIRTHHATGEVAHLGRAVDRMVRDFAERETSREALAKNQRETEVLRELRRNLKPMTVDPPVGFDLRTKLIEAAGAGTGDFVDALTDGEGRPTLVVGATATRGMPGALLMAMTRAYLRGAVMQGLGPAESCDLTNTSLNRDLARGLFASAIVARLDPTTALVELVSAGHKAPAVRFDADAGTLRKLQPNGIALGFDAGPIFRRSLESVSLKLAEGDALFLFSPAAFEAENAQGKQLGEKGVYALAKIAIDDGLDAMEGKLRAFLGGQPKGDLAFAVLRHVGRGGGVGAEPPA